MASMAIFSKISGEMKGAAKTTTLMLGLAVSIRILVSALKSVAELEWEDIGKGLLGVTVLMGEMVAALKLLGSDGKKVGKGATNVLIFAAAIKVLASACKDLGQLSWDELGKGLLGVGILLGEIDIFLNTAKFSGKTITTATGIVVLSAAIKILASACKDFGQMSWEGIAKGLGGIGVLLAEITAFTKLNGSAKGMVSTGVSLIAIGAAMKIFASAVSDFGQMSWEQIGKGLSAMGGALAEVAIAVNVMPKNMLSVGAGLVVVGTALEIISHVLGKMGGMSWEEIAKGLVAIGGALAELSIALNLMKGTLAGSAALLVASAAIAVLTPSLAILGAMSWEAIAKGLVTIAGAFTIMGVAGAVLGPLTPTILTQYVNLWSTKHRQAKDQATGELEGMRIDTLRKIVQLRADADKDLEDYKKVWQTKMMELDRSLQKDLEKLRTDFHKSIGLISKYTQEELTAMIGNVSQLLGEKGFNIGTNLLQEIIKGFEEKKPDLIQASTAIVTSVIDPISKGLGINSPSKVTYQLGEYAVRGFINAMNAMCPNVYETGSSLADASCEGLSNAVQYMMKILEDDIDAQPTIRPVVDLCDASKAMAHLDSMLYATRTAVLYPLCRCRCFARHAL